MGLFFKKEESVPSTKAVSVIKTFIIIGMAISMILGIINWGESIYIKIVFLLAGINLAIAGFEGLYHKENNNNRYILDFIFAFVWFLLFLIY